MLKFLRRPRQPASRVPDGTRVYAIGDVHGCHDELRALLALIEQDDARRGPAETHLILLGDLVDRGPDSAGVVELAKSLIARPRVHVLLGNHEEVLLRALDGDRDSLRLFSRIGGRETLASYGVNSAEWERADWDELAALLQARVPDEHRALLAGFEDMVRIGDYAFVHAGIRPGVPLDEQRQEDLRWIRSEFLNHRGPHPAVIVHGHTISDAAELRDERIGIDTGAFQSGRLTALGLEGSERWLLDTKQPG